MLVARPGAPVCTCGSSTKWKLPDNHWHCERENVPGLRPLACTTCKGARAAGDASRSAAECATYGIDDEARSAVIVGLAALVLNPFFGCGTVEFHDGADEMRPAVEGTWKLTVPAVPARSMQARLTGDVSRSGREFAG